MSDLLKKVRAAVEKRLAVVADHQLRDADPDAHLSQLKSVAGELDGLCAVLPDDTDPDLVHFLRQGSYVKAMAWFDLRDQQSV